MLLCAAGAHAQPGPAEAQRLFHAGVEAANAGRWVEARRDFERAYEALPRGEILVNLAAAQAQTDLLVEARASYRRALEAPELSDAMRAEVSSALEALEPTIPSVELSVTGGGADDRVAIDGNEIEARTGSVPVNPGHHRIAVMREGREIAGIDIDAERGHSSHAALAVSSEPIAEPVHERVALPIGHDPLVHVLGIGTLTAAAVAFFVLDGVTLALVGSCAQSTGATCTQRWALDEPSFGAFGAAAIASTLGAAIWLGVAAAIGDL